MHEPLGLPRGSVRAFLALSAWLTFLGVILWRGGAPEELSALVGVITITYFNARGQNGGGLPVVEASRDAAKAGKRSAR
jgi:hypothetical protein